MAIDVVEFFTPGTPAPQGSKKAIPVRNKATGAIVKVNQVESSAAVGPWRERVAIAAHNAMAGRAVHDGAVWVTLHFVMPRPKSCPKSRTPLAVKRPDVDKLARAVLDAITGVIVADDSQVVSLYAHKRLAEVGETAGVLVNTELVES